MEPINPLQRAGDFVEFSRKMFAYSYPQGPSERKQGTGRNRVLHPRCRKLLFESAEFDYGVKRAEADGAGNQ